MDSFGSRLKQARLSEGISQSELAAKLSVSQPLISNWELGNFAPNSEMIAEIEKIFGKIGDKAAPQDQRTELVTLASNAFGAWLRKERTSARMSVQELSKASGISAVAIYNIESGRSLNPQEETRARLERALNKSTPEEVTKEDAKEQDIVGVGTLESFDPYDKGGLPSVPGVYVFYDITERPIYIGKSDNIGRRIREHEDRFWFKQPIVDSASYVEIKDPAMRHSVEQVLIKFLKSNAVINKQSVDR